jgi:DNA mismatch repair protein MutL
MSDIIKLLPDSVANQIAAGEVIQRPASVIKELVENSVDASSTSISVHVKDAGRTLIQVIDNGNGMSPIDARMAFERHATSKISTAEDIFTIKTKGFRGEALASIAAVAQVELRTNTAGEELGTSIMINGSSVIKQEAVQQTQGSNFMVKNLFFNIPVRREFLKSDNYELSLIVEEFQRVALAHPEVAFSLNHNGREMFNFPKSNQKQRILHLFGKQFEKTLIPVTIKTNLVEINGFITLPEAAKAKGSQQYFIVNNRFIKHRSFYGAVMRAYNNILPEKKQPQYFLFFDINPGEIDINIHPTKTEVKFKQEAQIGSILEAVVKESLGKFNVKASIDFDDDISYHDMFKPKNGPISMPSIEIDPNFNPFSATDATIHKRTHNPSSPSLNNNRDNVSNWEDLYKGFEEEGKTEQKVFQSALNIEVESKQQETGAFMQFRQRYIITAVKSGIMMIDQKRAHERILYDRYMQSLKHDRLIVQNMLHPHVFTVNATDYELLKEALPEFRIMGFEMEDFGKNSFAVTGIPVDMKTSDIDSRLNELLMMYRENRLNSKLEVKESLARSLAKFNAIAYGTQLSSQEIQELINDLFSCQSPNLSPDGKKIVYIMENDEIASKF